MCASPKSSSFRRRKIRTLGDESDCRRKETPESCLAPDRRDGYSDGVPDRDGRRLRRRTEFYRLLCPQGSRMERLSMIDPQVAFDKFAQFTTPEEIAAFFRERNVSGRRANVISCV